MRKTFAETLKSLRTKRGLSQQQLANKLFVDRSTITRWESGGRVPDLTIVPQLATCLRTDANTLLDLTHAKDSQEVIVVDDERVVLMGTIPVIKEAMPRADVTGFTQPSKALDHIATHRVDLAFVDVEMGRTSGLELCQEIKDASPTTEVVFLTAYREYSLDAWNTDARGFLLKPVSAETLRGLLARLGIPAEQ